MKSIWTIAAKDLRLLVRDHAGLFWVLAFPLLMAVLFGSIFGGTGGRGSPMSVALVDEDGSAGAGAFVEMLEKSPALKSTRMPRPQAEEAVRRGRLAAYVVIQPGFGGTVPFFGGKTSLTIGMDPSRRVEEGYLRGLLMESSFRFMQQQLASNPASLQDQIRQSAQGIESDRGIPEEQRKVLGRFLGELQRFYGSINPQVYRSGPQVEGLRIETVSVAAEQARPRSAFEISFPQAILWGLIGCAAAFAISLVNERVSGTFLRLRMAPLSRSQVLAGKGTACFLACFFEILLLLVFGRILFGVRLENLVPLAMAALSVPVAFVGLMMLMSVLGKTEQAVAGAGWGILMVMSMFGGGMVPLLFMPAWMQSMSNWSPVKWAILAFEGGIWRNFSPAEMLLPCAILILTGTVAFFAGVRILAREG